MNDKAKIGIIAVLALVFTALFLLVNANGHWDYVLPRRGKIVAAIMLVGAAIAYSTVIFQTITNNRILTPSIIGLDSLYMLFQTAVVFVSGAEALAISNKQANFLISLGLMILFGSVLYTIFFRRNAGNLYFLLLVGIVCGIFFESISSFLQKLIDPNEFLIVQDRMFASFNRIDTDILLLAYIVFALVVLYSWKFRIYLDVLSLGREHAVNLGVDYDRVVKRLLLVVIVLISIATALAGPITFLGLLVANLAYQMLRTCRHSYLISGAVAISIAALVGGQLLVEHVFTFETTISIIINFIGGVYFIFLLLRENKT